MRQRGSYSGPVKLHLDLLLIPALLPGKSAILETTLPVSGTYQRSPKCAYARAPVVNSRRGSLEEDMDMGEIADKKKQDYHGFLDREIHLQEIDPTKFIKFGSEIWRWVLAVNVYIKLQLLNYIVLPSLSQIITRWLWSLITRWHFMNVIYIHQVACNYAFPVYMWV